MPTPYRLDERIDVLSTEPAFGRSPVQPPRPFPPPEFENFKAFDRARYRQQQPNLFDTDDPLLQEDSSRTDERRLAMSFPEW
jgi:hypothetical protein